MPSYSPTLRNHIERLIEQRISPPTVGEVVEVYEHTSSSDDSNFEADVKVSPTVDSDGTIGDHTYRRVPVLQPTGQSVFVPTVGDHVLITFIDAKNPIVLGSVYTESNRAMLGNEGILRHKRGSLYTEMHASGDWARIAKKGSDDGTPSAKLEVDDSGGNTIVRVQNGSNDMGLQLNMGTGEFKLGDSSGYGIVSDGSGNFTWYEQSVNFVDDGSTITW